MFQSDYQKPKVEMFHCLEADCPCMTNTHEQAKGPRRLVITIVNARHLPRMDYFRKIDPYCSVEFFGFEHQTAVLTSNYSPEWNASYYFDVDDIEQEPGKLRVSLFDWGRLKSKEYVGDVEISATRMWKVMQAPIGWQEEKYWQVTNVRKPVIGNDKRPSIITLRLLVLEIMQTEIPIELDFLDQAMRRVEVTIVSAKHLPIKDELGSINPFCIVKFANYEYKTSTILNNNSWDWDESFDFEISDCTQPPGPLRITFMDSHRPASNKKIGEAVVSSKRMWDIARARTEWTEERDFPISLVQGFNKDTSIVTLRLRILKSDRESCESLCCASGSPVHHESVQMFSMDDGGIIRPGEFVTRHLQQQSKSAGGRINTTRSVQGIARSLVSGKKRRFTEGGFDLDLTYITPRVIAMGYPSEGLLESNYRNSMADVYRFFQQRHAQHYLVVNLCSEREYNFDIFHGSCVRYPFPDHKPPALELILPCCTSMHRFLQRDENNVVAVHCKAGKGRTGLMVVCYLLFCGFKSTARSARCLYDWARTKDGKGLTMISQIRYAHYFESILRTLAAGAPPPETSEDRAAAVGIVHVRIHTIPRFDASGCDPVFAVSVRSAADHSEYTIFHSDGGSASGSSKGSGGGGGDRWLSERTDALERSVSARSTHAEPAAPQEEATRSDGGRFDERWDIFPEGGLCGAVRVAGDFHMSFYNRRRGCATVDVKRMFHFWLHTGMLTQPPAEMGGRARELSDSECKAEGLPSGTWSLTLAKHEIDKAAGDGHCTRFDATFGVEVFWVHLPGQTGTGPALEAARAPPGGQRRSWSSSQNLGAGGEAQPLAAEREGYLRMLQERAAAGLRAPAFEEWLLGRCEQDGAWPLSPAQISVPPPSPVMSPLATPWPSAAKVPPLQCSPAGGDKVAGGGRGDGGSDGVVVYKGSCEANSDEDDDDEYNDDISCDETLAAPSSTADSMASLARTLSAQSESLPVVGSAGEPPAATLSVRARSLAWHMRSGWRGAE